VSPNTYCTYYVETTTSTSNTIVCTVCKNRDDEGISQRTDDEYEAAQESTEACLANDQMYQETMEIVEAGQSFDPNQDPAQDPNGGWMVTTYGDCSTCEANFARAVDFERSEKNAEWYAFATVWLVVGGFCGVISANLFRINRRHRSMRHHSIELLGANSGVSA
jgi:hypothetical protein